MRKLPAMMVADGALFAMMFDQPAGQSPVDIGSAGATWSESNGNMPLGYANDFLGRYQLQASSYECINIPKQSSVMPTTALTVEVLFTMPASMATAFRPISCTESGGWNIQGSGSSIQFSIFKNSAGAYITATAGSGSLPAAGSMCHVVGTFDGQNVSIYVNGTLIGSSSDATGTSTIKYATSAGILIGNEPNNSGIANGASLLGGSICAAAIYGAALTPTQIAAHAALGQKNKTLSGFALLDDGSPASRVLVRNIDTQHTIADLTPAATTGAWSASVFDDYYDVVTYGPSGYRPVADSPVQP